MLYMEIDGRRKELFAKLINKWDSTLRRYEQVMREEHLPYVYGERPNLGILSIAATKLGFITLEEYETKRKGKYGRADLWMYDKTLNIDVSVEAKFVTLSWKSKILAETIKKKLALAVDEVSVVDEDLSCSLGIVFVRPEGATPANFQPTDYWAQIKDRSSIGADFCAMHICKTKTWANQKYAKGCPGIVMAGKFHKSI
ncbi:hypothetical protein ACFLYI_01180 [Chloroflexota bacterium]